MSRIDLIPQTILSCVLHNICLDGGDVFDEEIEDDIFNEAINDINVEDDIDEILHAEGDVEGVNKRNRITQILYELH